MHESEQPEFATLMTNVMAYYGKDASDFLLDAWWSACNGVSFEEFQKAINAHIRNSEFAPKVSDVVKVLHGSTTDRATLAWGKVLGAISAVGAYQDVVFDDPAIHAAIVDCGGWQKVCRGDLKELSYLQHRFCASHKAYTERGAFDYPKQLSGDRSPDSEYEKFGLPLPKPAIVGDQERAAMVLAHGGTGGPQIAFKAVVDLVAIPNNMKAAA